MSVSPDEVISPSIEPLVIAFAEQLMKCYLASLYEHVQQNPHLMAKTSGFLLEHEEIVIYVGRTHIAVEYLGSELSKEIQAKEIFPLKLRYFDYSIDDANLLEKIIGFKYDSTAKLKLPLPSFSEDLLMPTNRGWEKLTELGWNFAAQNSIMGINIPAMSPTPGRFSRIVNGLFFDANSSGLRTRHVKWLDFVPINFDGTDPLKDSISFSLEFLRALVPQDAEYVYPMPDDYKYEKLPKINRFIEIWGNAENSEPVITQFIAEPENRFILTMRFGASEIYPERLCEWQGEIRDAIKPDFFVLQSNGYADIVEFKLPEIDKAFIVWGNNREAFAAWLTSYIAQTRVYSSYFDDPNNRIWFEKEYGFKVHKPKRWLVVGRRSDFKSEVWREIIADYRDIEILTFDDIVDGVVAQFYK